MKFRLGRYKVTKNFSAPELIIETRLFLLDIDLNPKFPYGWCAALSIPRDQPWKLYFHSSWHAWNGEGSTIDAWLGRLEIRVNMPTWWRFRETGREVHERNGRAIPAIRGHYYRTWPYMPWPVIEIRKQPR